MVTTTNSTEASKPLFKWSTYTLFILIQLCQKKATYKNSLKGEITLKLKYEVMAKEIQSYSDFPQGASSLKGTALKARFKRCMKDVQSKVAADFEGSNLSSLNSDKYLALDAGERLVYSMLKEVANDNDKNLEETEKKKARNTTMLGHEKTSLFNGKRQKTSALKDVESSDSDDKDDKEDDGDNGDNGDEVNVENDGATASCITGKKEKKPKNKKPKPIPIPMDKKSTLSVIKDMDECLSNKKRGIVSEEVTFDNYSDVMLMLY
jgi:hypothetical protein